MDTVQLGDGVIAVIGEVALEAGELALIAEVPFLGLPVIKQIWEFLVGKLFGKVILEMQKQSAAWIITITDAHEGTAAREASDALKKAQADPATKPEDVANAKEEFKKRYRDLVRSRLSTSR